MPEYVANPPDARSLMTSARSFGNYDLAGAFADLIDNSIQADASTVELLCNFNGGKPEVRIVDDGHGMTAAELQSAMQPASSNPLEERGPNDLGRFGWGLKSASFSQCRKLTVISRRNQAICGAAWDLKDISGWKMQVLSEAECEEIRSPALPDSSGTEVIWDDCDRLSEMGKLDQASFNALMIHARARLGLTFHRFLTGEARRRPKVALSLNGHEIPAFDPFYRDHHATQPLEPESLRVGDSDEVLIRPFILPHFRFLASSEFEQIAGDEGMLKNQGFYVYRNDRLILHGTWFRLIHHGELSQLTRVAVDIPNSLDEMWRLTIDKKDVQLPALLRSRLAQLVHGFRRKSRKVYRGKSSRPSTRSSSVDLWTRLSRAGEYRYEINRDHPLIENLFVCEEAERSRAVTAALSAIENGFPVAAFAADLSRDSDSINQSPTTPEALAEFFRAAIPTQLASHGGDVTQLKDAITNVEPFKSNWKAVIEFLKSEGFSREQE
jgi:hypothetical protein